MRHFQAEKGRAQVKPKALIYGRNEGAPYHPLGPIEVEVVSIFSVDFEVEVTDRGESLLSSDLGGTDLLVGLDDRWTEPLDRNQLGSVESWVRRGGILLLIHNGICWSRDKRWRILAGGRFTGHGPARNLTFSRRSDGASFDLFEEPYRFSTPWFNRNHVLVDYEDEGKKWPALWTRKVGRGRIAYALPGHAVEAFRQPLYRDWLLHLVGEDAVEA